MKLWNNNLSQFQRQALLHLCMLDAQSLQLQIQLEEFISQIKTLMITLILPTQFFPDSTYWLQSGMKILKRRMMHWQHLCLTRTWNLTLKLDSWAKKFTLKKELKLWRSCKIIYLVKLKSERLMLTSKLIKTYWKSTLCIRNACVTLNWMSLTSIKYNNSMQTLEESQTLLVESLSLSVISSQYYVCLKLMLKFTYATM